MNSRTRLRLLLLLCFSAVLMACSGGEETTTEGVASAADLDGAVENAEDVAAVAVTNDGEALTAEEAALELSVCMRDNGWPDFPDPVIGDNGALNLRAAIGDSGIDATDEGFRDQITICRETSGADNLGAGARGEGREQIQEQLLGYTQCLRDEGLDVGDLGAPGEGAGQGNNAGQGTDGDGPGAGRAAGNVGNVGGRGDRIAQALGLDASDPATEAALAACDEILTEAFAGIGGNRPEAAAPADDNS